MASRVMSDTHRPATSGYTRPRKRTYVKVTAKATMPELLKTLKAPPRFIYTSEFESSQFEALMQERWRRSEAEGESK